MVVPFDLGRCDGDDFGEAAGADGDRVAVVCGEDCVSEEPSGVVGFSEISGFDVDGLAHPARSRQVRKILARTLLVCRQSSHRLTISAW